MINRLKDYLEEPDERPCEDDYFVVDAGLSFFYVSQEVAEQILAAVESYVSPRWIRFTDVNGSRVCVRTRLIEYVREWTVGQRAAQRAFRRARRLEEKADRRPWEDDDD